MKKIHIIFTGGTIAMQTNDQGLLIPAVTGDELLKSIPALQHVGEISTQQFSNQPSAQMTPELMQSLRKEIVSIFSKNEIEGIVVVHGTDTMEETAFFLDASLSEAQLKNNPVILTGAMRSNDQASADGMANLLAATQVAADANSKGRGVMVVMNDEIHSARYVKKMDTSSLHTFCSPQYAALGQISHATSHAPVQYKHSAIRLTKTIDVPRETFEFPRVDVVQMYAGADAALLNASIEAGAQAVVIQAVGASSVNLALYEGIKQAISKGTAIIISSRSPLGECAPVYGYIGGGQTLKALGAAFSADLPAHKARLYAQLLLNNKKNTSESHLETIQHGFSTV
ncbi:L-asparaginase [Ephemeroptericola cinctiostellae]|uniref:L-asparaginase n=1 Tax=Ephemeroptericola cinctiostellae TaxID=2268024 RepID=A0A345D8K7_9BURK|nr:asparaginase [Ephemeroptericola cinctiostellae]AXF84695.1 L-asparaginase [Ephemeroptericola cinctiostellae]